MPPPLRDQWSRTPDTRFAVRRLLEKPNAALAADEPGLSASHPRRGGLLGIGRFRHVLRRFERGSANAHPACGSSKAIAYDCIWTSGTLHSLVNLEHVLAQVRRALRPGGLFKVERLECPRAPFQLSPFQTVRSSDVLPLLNATPGFEIVHLRTSGWLFPLTMLVDVEDLVHERPDVWERLRRAGRKARDDPHLRPVGADVVLRAR